MAQSKVILSLSFIKGDYLVPPFMCIYERSNNFAQSGIYEIFLPNSSRTIRVYCDMDTEGGGWTVFQRRQDGSMDFHRKWNDYRRGFGNIGVEFWLGLDYLHELLSLSENELRVDLGDGNGNRAYANYSTFSAGNESTKYVLSVSGYSGNAGDSLTYSTTMALNLRPKTKTMISGAVTIVPFRGTVLGGTTIAIFLT